MVGSIEMIALANIMLLMSTYLTLRALVDFSLLDPLTQPLAEVAVSQVPEEHIPASEVAAAKRAGLAVGLLSF